MQRSLFFGAGSEFRTRMMRILGCAPRGAAGRSSSSRRCSASVRYTDVFFTSAAAAAESTVQQRGQVDQSVRPSQASQLARFTEPSLIIRNRNPNLLSERLSVSRNPLPINMLCIVD